MAWTFEVADRAGDLATQIGDLDLTDVLFSAIDRNLRTMVVTMLNRMPPQAGVVALVTNDDQGSITVRLKRFRFGSYAT